MDLKELEYPQGCHAGYGKTWSLPEEGLTSEGAKSHSSDNLSDPLKRETRTLQ